MGCCISRQTGPNSPYPGIATGASSARATHESPHHHGQPLAQHINKPLRRHVWANRTPQWSTDALDRERTDFFDTRVAGRPEVWQTLRAALEVLWVADRAILVQQQHNTHEEAPVLSVEDPAVALATAQSILSAADVTLPTGDLAQGAYDALGNYYAIPEHIVADPTNVVVTTTGGEPNTIQEGSKADLAGGEDGTEDMDATLAADTARKREEKGKAVLVGRDQITVRARLSEGSQDVTVTVGNSESVRTIARRMAEEAQLSGNKKVRIAYMGKILKEGSSLPAQGWKPGHMLNALVFNR